MASRLYHASIRFSAHNSFRMQTFVPLNRNLTNTPSHAFFVRRTKTNNIPVYLDYKGGGTRTLTIVRKIDGDAKALEKKLREVIRNRDLMTRTDELTGQIVLHGDYKSIVMKYLKSIGF
ncbi:PREDICTED: 54S ribosomal protein img2, mitochondrial-like [Amphimedon queenslandica]|uniref:Large ribosomal subunit protein mL49 n=1 Tax=Amphimedon queenslandica TaxID=400682 RepID=A0A1X7TY93_AMPQE|nr:PREDICTED: 54S ribosomal protein img2, mitochondrial-like [Amphimedon queenslandica]|eukprot:XP_003389524.1 PREDICTED: 54S ribosomal protein img2, mitochondrial-like [Amphimedon queenslandica]